MEEKMFWQKAVAVAQVIDCVPLGEAQHILDSAKALLLETHVVNCDGDRFKTKVAELCSFFDE